MLLLFRIYECWSAQVLIRFIAVQDHSPTTFAFQPPLVRVCSGVTQPHCAEHPPRSAFKADEVQLKSLCLTHS
jgi:hypothetical protein